LTDEEIKEYLSDLDNLIDTGHFQNKSVKDYTFHHKGLTLVDFVAKGRELIRNYLLSRLRRQPPINEEDNEVSGWEKWYITSWMMTQYDCSMPHLRTKYGTWRDYGSDKNEVIHLAKENVRIKKWLAGKEIIKEIFVPGKLINFVI